MMSRYPMAELIRQRRTVRRFKPDSVPRGLLMELLEVANWAPNHGLREPWRYILYEGAAREAFTDAVIGAMTAEEKTKYAEIRRAYYLEIPVHLIVAMKQDPRQKQWDEDYAAVCCWIQCFLLAAWERGLGAVWKTNTYAYAPAFRSAIGVADGEKIVGVLHIGYPAAVPDARPRTSAERLLTVRDGTEADGVRS